MSIPVAAWPDIAEALCGVWPRAAAIQDLRWYADQTRMQRVKRIPGYRRLARRWGWTEHQARKLMRAEGDWQDPRHTTPPPPSRTPPAPISQTSPAPVSKSGVETERPAQTSPAPRAVFATGAELHTPHIHKNTILNRPAGACEDISGTAPAAPTSAPPPKDNHSLPLSAVSGSGRGLIWGDLVRHLEGSGYETLGQLAEAGRDTVAGDLGRNASAGRLDRIQRCLHSRALLADNDWSGTPAGRPARRSARDEEPSGGPSAAFYETLRNGRGIQRTY
jgi:hypothetical protein